VFFQNRCQIGGRLRRKTEAKMTTPPIPMHREGSMHRVVSEYKVPENELSNIKVFIRARPLEDGSAPGEFISIGI
jgi:hypothetical protein